ncbi:hypothetical protein C8F01DRAFT_1217270 [Mycena amicta]|nr:hypothetical protein C8F01DRAFT_1217270 [Mycena amicta]
MSRVQLEPVAGPCRSRAVATENLSAGSCVISCPPLATILLPQEKGRRCDYCHILAPDLRKCSGCAEYLYCGAACQALQWTAHHRRLCKRIGKYAVSTAFQALAEHEKLDAMLLSHTVAQLDGDSGEALQSVLSLLPAPVEPPLLPIIYASSRFSSAEVRSLYARFGNNNFVLHTHLTTFGHGVFPLASRYFNHSCLPNAAVKYVLAKCELPRMEVVALRDISEGEEICLPYLDPALLQSRRQIFQLTYGFDCRCDSCRFFGKLGRIPESPSSVDEQNSLAKRLRDFYEDSPFDGLTFTKASPVIPTDLLPVFHESFITHLAETFSNASHDGEYATAISSGGSLLALYRLVYPPNYPQIGMHLLEMAKTCWNSSVTQEIAYKMEITSYLDEAKRILCILGAEGDVDGPLVEIDTLHNLITVT